MTSLVNTSHMRNISIFNALGAVSELTAAYSALADSHVRIFSIYFFIYLLLLFSLSRCCV